MAHVTEESQALGLLFPLSTERLLDTSLRHLCRCALKGTGVPILGRGCFAVETMREEPTHQDSRDLCVPVTGRASLAPEFLAQQVRRQA